MEENTTDFKLISFKPVKARRFVASGSSDKKEIAKRNAAKQALHLLSPSVTTDLGMLEFPAQPDGSYEIKEAKQKLHELCHKKRWPKPIYSIEEEVGPPHNKKYVCSVQIATGKGVSITVGDKMSRVREAENSAASYSVRALQQSNISDAGLLSGR